MRHSIWLAMVLLVLPAAQVWARPPVTTKAVTGKDVPSPGPVQARLWGEALLQALCFDDRLPQSEAVRMLLTLQRGERLGPNVGWYGPSQRRHDWAWLAARYDADGDGRISAKEFTGPAAWFTRLDR